jgi:hypothetical protein
MLSLAVNLRVGIFNVTEPILVAVIDALLVVVRALLLTVILVGELTAVM